MRELIGVLEREAGRLHPRPDLDDVLLRASRRRRRSRAAAAVIVAVAVLGLVTAATWRPEGGQQLATSVAGQPAPIDLAAVGGPSIAGAGPDASYPATNLERIDPEAAAGPWTVVLRESGGALDDPSVAITYPAAPVPGSMAEFGHSDSSGGIQRRTFVRSMGSGRLVRVARSGNLPDGEMVRVADAVSIVDGRPVVADGLLTGDRAYEVVAAGPTRPSMVAEARYGCDSLGESDDLGGLCYAGLTASQGFETALFEAGFTAGPDLDGHPTAVSGVGGGNGTLAWEIHPGVIAFVGYSGAAMGPDQIEALHRLASRFELLSPAAWAATGPQVVEQTTGWTG